MWLLGLEKNLNENIYIYTRKTKLFAVHLKQTQRCKLTIVQVFKKIREKEKHVKLKIGGRKEGEERVEIHEV